MAMTAAQQATWLEIVKAYDDWNAGNNALMPVHELDTSVEASSDQIGDALAQAAADSLVDLGGIGAELAFRPRRK
ncbi:hypothetical protein D3870_11980 [Noviherbaspirillum cavernae]|uniref:Uncharacterized protein n=1 Tax=Noviherbaspirillum cavernae TaxID=2320862 RepID=A0A418X2H6_9BURK|nr:hypothetical protein [Noviherbaspirillum cavernae]RJG06634.1 hypothetical protein D3870_11980 [Noviherbaspirillum cavernae]